MRNCGYCGKLTQNRVYCSRSCLSTSNNLQRHHGIPAPEIITRKCVYCGLDTTNTRFCTKSCAASYNNSRAPKRVKAPNNTCVVCGNTCSNAVATKCSAKCRGIAIRKDQNATYENWQSGVWIPPYQENFPSYLKEEYRVKHNFKCVECGWDTPHPVTGVPLLHMDHIDGDPFNHNFSNLRLLCLRCHGQTATFGGLNVRSVRLKNGFIDFGREYARPSRHR